MNYTIFIISNLIYLSLNCLIILGYLLIINWQSNHLDSSLIGFGQIILYILLIYLFKITLFPIIYAIFNRVAFVENFYKKFINDKDYRENILFSALIFDVFAIIFFAGFILAKSGEIMISGMILIILLTSIMCGGGVLFSYLGFVLWIKIRRVGK